ncbi:XRE family transcriptional regulator [Jiangella ureilytica]|uniref:XRE family transcriptional regulator n=1 Tax=Jiangella ureilytica TaxID=2530374 RepID=A0A4R4RW86_9ACTN|nr:helix-turn-helix transcriptional regulator [Jiangella ureilytica]TDC53986.1 XRE family transcriptional regulator [Jiangella ureilytica]
MTAPLERSDDWPQVARALGVRVSSLRLSRGLTQEQLAHLAGISRGYLQKVEHARACPGLDVLLRIARALGVTVVDLLPVGIAGLRDDDPGAVDESCRYS